MDKQDFIRLTENTLESRGKEYGPGGNEVNAICKAFTALTGIDFKPVHLNLVMHLMKTKRHLSHPKADNWIDMAGYTTICQEAEDEG